MAGSTLIDRDVALTGLVGIGLRLYGEGECSSEPGPKSILACERAVFAHLFDQSWRDASDDERMAMREVLPGQSEEFDRMLADYELRRTERLFGMSISQARAELDADGPAS